MTKAEFLAQLQAALSRLPQSEIDHSLAFYAEMIDDRIEDGISEQDAVAQLGSVEQIAAQIISEAPFVPRTVAKAKSKPSNMTLIIILLIVLSPIWFPLGLSVFFTVLGLYISIWAVIIGLWAAVLALGIAGFACLGATIYLIITGHPLTAVLSAGAGLLCLGLGVFGFIGMLALTKLFCKFTVFISLKIKSLFVRQTNQVRQEANNG
jgi:uncharacterized membrane protein